MSRCPSCSRGASARGCTHVGRPRCARAWCRSKATAPMARWPCCAPRWTPTGRRGEGAAGVVQARSGIGLAAVHAAGAAPGPTGARGALQGATRRCHRSVWLSETLNLSRVTARKAIDELVEQGLIVRRHGSGNYIAPQHRAAAVAADQLFRRAAPARLRAVVALAQARLHRRCARRTTERSDCRPARSVARLERLRLADGTVMAYEVSVLPAPVLPDPAAVDGSLYEHLSELGRAPARALQHLRAMNAQRAPCRAAGRARRARRCCSSRAWAISTAARRWS